MTTDLDGQRAFVMTLRAREQDIRRDKAASNICTNQALLALAASIYLAAIGPHGLRDVAATGAARAAELADALTAIGIERVHDGPYLNEFAVRVPDARTVHRRLLERGFLAGLVLADAEPDDPRFVDALLLCTTELTTSGDIARFVAALAEVLAGRPSVGVETGAGDVAATPAGAAR
jgi:glycine dehydrogenase subunit 1